MALPVVEKLEKAEKAAERVVEKPIERPIKLEHHEERKPLELPKLGKENKSKMNDTNSNFMELLEQKMAEFDKPREEGPKRKEESRNSFHKNLVERKPTIEQ